ncbi:protein STICHEL-like 4 [Iris pallida]|uniref:Protein STICHEL-like 4 n=1 Tax=Iris pallida TaxID=29817 RepID=A0AAX6GPV4_IRIPA|nr:protein STICHEL-like 4 [Iris pallida]
MTRAIRRNYLKDDSCSIVFPLSDHLRNHVHLTNCIHLKNHMHRHSPVVSERALMRDLIALQRSRSLRDPSTSPPSWISPCGIEALGKKPTKDGSLHSGRRSLGVDRRREIGAGRLSVSSPRANSAATSKVAAAEDSNDHVFDDADKDEGISKGEGGGRKTRKSKGKNVHSKTLSERLEEPPSQTDNESRRNSGQCRYGVEDNIAEEAGAVHVHGSGLKRMKKRRFKGGRRVRGSIDSRDFGIHNEQPFDSNSLGRGSLRRSYHLGDGQEEDTELEVSRAPRNGCGIPWNWSRIHHRGKSILDIAGRSLSCGLSDPRLRKAEGSLPQSQRDNSKLPITSDQLTSSTDSESEALPLLIEPPGSQESNGDKFLVHDYSGELGIYANNTSRNGQDSDLESEARSGSRHNSKGGHLGRHRSLTQKYMPKTFKDLVGQSLVVQALSNAVSKRKVGLIYVFYGPHGTGKTSCARVFAKALNCQSAEHPKPCDVCAPCISHNLGRSRNVTEVGPVSAFDYENILGNVFDKAMMSPLSSQYRVFIFDDCDTLPTDSWSIISKVIDRAPRHVVFILVSSSVDHLPHMIISRCQKFFFPKLKDSDIIYTLQWIAISEGLQIDKDALKLIASRSDGSLRDAEMTLEQLSLLGQRISLPLVQELVGLVSDEKLVDLLDLALSAHTVNTVKNLREIMETGVEPLALMSQLATIITDILAGTYVFTRERLRRNFFRRSTLSKEDMEKLRQALKTLSEAEKQLRMSNDKSTWLTAALLQLAPDQQYTLPTSSTYSSLNHSPIGVNCTSQRDLPRNSADGREDLLSSDRGLLRAAVGNPSNTGANSLVQDNRKRGITSYIIGKRNGDNALESPIRYAEATITNGGSKCGRSCKDYERIWRVVLDNVQSETVKQFLFQEGNLISVSFGTAPTVQLMFTSPTSKVKAEKFRGQILQAFESVLQSAVRLEIRCETRKDERQDAHIPVDLVASENGSQLTRRRSMTNQRSQCSESENFVRGLPRDNVVKGTGSSQSRWLHDDPLDMDKGEITEIVASPQAHQKFRLTESSSQCTGKGLENMWLDETSSMQHQSNLGLSENRESEEHHRKQSLVRGKVSLAHVIQQAEGCSQRGAWSRRKAISIAEKLEQENLRLEPRSRSLLCWRVPRIPQRKLPHLRIRTKKPRYLLKIVTCGRCLGGRSPSSFGKIVTCGRCLGGRSPR